MQMLRSPAKARGWLAGFRPRPVVLSSPYPAIECLRQLAMATTQRGSVSWYLDSRTAGRPDPRLRGDAYPSRIFVARWEDAGGRNSFVPWLDARLEPAAGGGTALTGRIGLHPAARAVIALVAAAGGLIALAAIATGAAVLARGQLGGLVPAILAPLAITALIAGFSAAGLRSLERDILKLIREVNGIVDSTATFTDQTPGGNVA